MKQSVVFTAFLIPALGAAFAAILGASPRLVSILATIGNVVACFALLRSNPRRPF